MEESWQLNFYCTKNVEKRSKGLTCFSLRANTREMMNVSRISRMVVWQFVFDVFGDFELSVKCVLSWKKYLLHCGSSKGFGTERSRGVELITPTDPTLNVYLVSKRNHVEVVELISMGILLLGMRCHFTWGNLLTPREEIKMRLIPCGP